MTLVHALLCIVMIFGVIFSKTRITQGAVLATLLLLFIGIRIFKTCAMDMLEECTDKPILADIGMATIFEGYSALTKYQYEQAAVGSLLIIHIIKIYALSIYPVDTLF